MSAARLAARGGLLVAAVWPFVITGSQWHRIGIEAVALALVGLSLVVMVGWLRSASLFQAGAVLAGGAVAARVLATAETLLPALLGAAVAGALVGVASVALAWRRPVVLLPLSSLAVTVLVVTAVPRLAGPAPFARPVIVGIDLAGDRAVYLLLLVLLAVAIVVLTRLERAPLGAAWRLVGGAPSLAGRTGVDAQHAWLSAGLIAGGLGGLAGGALALAAQGTPELGPAPAALAVSYLGIVLLGGARPAGAVVGGVVVAGFAQLPSMDVLTVGALAAVVGWLLLPGGLVGAARSLLARRRRPVVETETRT